MMSEITTPTRGEKRQDSFTTPDSKQFNLDYYFSSAPSSKSPHRRLRRHTSTRALRSLVRYHQTRANRSPYDTSPYTPSKLSKVMIADYEQELAITDIGTPPLTMPTRHFLNKKLPPKPLFRLGNSPERRGLLDATDLNSSSLQFPILQPKSAVKESAVTKPVTPEPITEDLTPVFTPSLSNNSYADSDFEVGVAQIGTAYDALTISELSTPPIDGDMAPPVIRETNASVKRQQYNQAKFTSTPDTNKGKEYGLNPPRGDVRPKSQVHMASLQNNGSPRPKKDRRSRSSQGSSSIINVVSRYSTNLENRLSAKLANNEASTETLIQVSHNSHDLIDIPVQGVVDAPTQVGDREDSTQGVVQDTDAVEFALGAAVQDADATDVVFGAAVQDTAQDADPADLPVEVGVPEQTQLPLNSVVQAVARTGPMDRSESQTTLGRKKKMAPPPSKRFARDADRTILGRSPPYSKVTKRVYLNDAVEERPLAALHSLTRKVSTKGLRGVLATRAGSSNSTHARRQSSLPDSPENQTLQPPSLMVEKRQSVTERLTKPTASSAARAKSRTSAPSQKSSAMASVKNAGKGLKSRISGMMRNRRASGVVGVVDPAANSSGSAPKDTSAQNNAASVVLDKAPEIAPFENDRDVGEEFASFYSQMTYPIEQSADAGKNATDFLSGGSGLVDSQVIEPSSLVAQFSTMSEAEADAISGAPGASPPSPVISETLQSLTILDEPTPALLSHLQETQENDENVSPADVQVAAGDGASDPPPNEAGNGGHADELVQPPTIEEMCEEIINTLNTVLDALSVAPDEASQAVLSEYAEVLTRKVTLINDMRQAMVLLQNSVETTVYETSIQSYQVRSNLHDLTRIASNN
ncbi:hypothetical protein NHQ30_003279 [Ciborinia camelliae]|nr:hypothetical protein NHQ30_003279 [Ciborinia camelliae]